MLSREAFAALDHLGIAPRAASDTEPAAMIDALLAKKGLRRRVQMTVPHFLVAPFVVAGSDLVLTAPARLLAPFRKSPKLRAIALPLKLPGYELAQVWAARTRSDEALRRLRGVVAATFQP